MTVKPISITISTRPPKQRGATMSFVTIPVDRKARGEHPHDQQEPGRDQQHGAVEARAPRDTTAQVPRPRRSPAKCVRRRNATGDEPPRRGQRAEEHEPARRDVRIAHVPAVEIEIGEQETTKVAASIDSPDARQTRSGGGEVDTLPEAEVGADVNEHRPAERRAAETSRCLHDEQDGEEQREQAAIPITMPW